MNLFVHPYPEEMDLRPFSKLVSWPAMPKFNYLFSYFSVFHIYTLINGVYNWPHGQIKIKKRDSHFGTRIDAEEFFCPCRLNWDPHPVNHKSWLVIAFSLLWFENDVVRIVLQKIWLDPNGIWKGFVTNFWDEVFK